MQTWDRIYAKLSKIPPEDTRKIEEIALKLKEIDIGLKVEGTEDRSMELVTRTAVTRRDPGSTARQAMFMSTVCSITRYNSIAF